MIIGPSWVMTGMRGFEYCPWGLQSSPQKENEDHVLDMVPIGLTCSRCFSFILPQNRHPERSASQIHRVTQRLWRGVEGPRRCLFYPRCSELLTTEARQHDLLRYALDGVHLFMHCSHLPSPSLCEHFELEPAVKKAPSSMGKISIAEVLRLRATSAASRDESVRRFAQDDDSVGELTKQRPLCGSRGALQIPRLRSG
jgi:hypothetical protein